MQYLLVSFKCFIERMIIQTDRNTTKQSWFNTLSPHCIFHIDSDRMVFSLKLTLKITFKES